MGVLEFVVAVIVGGFVLGAGIGAYELITDDTRRPSTSTADGGRADGDGVADGGASTQ